MAKRGFAAMDENKQRQIASKGGKASRGGNSSQGSQNASGAAGDTEAARRGGQNSRRNR
jgi:uncharacterized protein